MARNSTSVFIANLIHGRYLKFVKDWYHDEMQYDS